MEQITKREAAEKIVEDMIETITTDETIGEVRDTLMYGCEGWYNQASSELEQELLNRFNTKYKVI